MLGIRQFVNLDSNAADRYLPHVIASVLEGKLGVLGDRLGRLLFKLTVEECMLMHIIASDTDIDLPTLDKLRGRCMDKSVQRSLKEAHVNLSATISRLDRLLSTHAWLLSRLYPIYQDLEALNYDLQEYATAAKNGCDGYTQRINDELNNADNGLFARR